MNLTTLNLFKKISIIYLVKKRKERIMPKYIMLNTTNKDILSPATDSIMAILKDANNALLVANIVKFILEEIATDKTIRIPVYEEKQEIIVFNQAIEVPYIKEKALLCSTIAYVLYLSKSIEKIESINGLGLAIKQKIRLNEV